MEKVRQVTIDQEKMKMSGPFKIERFLGDQNGISRLQTNTNKRGLIVNTKNHTASTGHF